MTIAFLGLGNMGAPMAAHLVTAGHHVVGYDPAPAAADQATARGVTVTDSLTAAVRGAEAVITMLPTGQHLADCYDAVLAHATPGALLVDCSTVAVTDAQAAAARATDAGFAPLDAPVSGGVAGAAAGTLTFMVGGAAAALETARPLLDAMGTRIIHCGPSGSGQAAKTCNNMVLGISMIAVSEAFLLGRSLGLSDQALFDVASTSSAQCWALTSYCPVPGPVPTSPANRDYQGGFSALLMRKDLHLAQASAARADVATPLGAAAAVLYDQFVAAGNGARDFSAIITALATRTSPPEATA
ncbi:3-hydroxyisobutyrate dehydrogenase [Verrucosispora sp. SN26_14.1]|uniref:3-hydroxyisobutyrate dehydrogenase n=1 Tax=Verrucosispora sp. SN26_14.1 TaxID=2527879 RepID=UPI0010333912|nr:3-hydroxyisobutyrate dehydrogenase [Verrucosispora sp. SN26_14.1]TBL40658.1 3-hydroxyisobutyrate dehydrogenase [Verrucosispora sp. SN26_14.1]